MDVLAFLLLLFLLICLSIARALDAHGKVLRIESQSAPKSLIADGAERQAQQRRSTIATDDDSTTTTTTFVGTIDGMVHAIDAQTGRQLWSFSSGDALFSSSVSLEQSASSSTAPVFIPGVDGTVFAHAADQKLRRLPITVKDLVAKSPFQTADGTLLVGRKESRVFVLDRRTGAVLRAFGDNVAETFVELVEGAEPLSRDTIVIGRSDYHVSALDPLSGLLAWNMSRYTACVVVAFVRFP
jgi:outer membrane protein assembly factor BamB